MTTALTKQNDLAVATGAPSSVPTGEIHCAFAIDDQYCQHLSAVLVSILRHSPAACFHFHVLHHKVTAANLSKLSETSLPQSRVSLSFYCIDDGLLQTLRVDGHISVASYLRLFLSEILPPDVKRVIYLDSDIIVLDDLAYLWNIDLLGKPVAAAADLFMLETDRPGAPADHVYFNAGVLVIDLDRWRSREIFREFIELAIGKSDILKYHDQDVLNIVFAGSAYYIPSTWNYQARTSRPGHDFETALGHVSSLRETTPSIVHFAGAEKPWIYYYDVPFEGVYFRYLAETPWRGFIPPDKTLPAVLRRYVWRYAPWFGRMLQRSLANPGL